MALRFVVGVIAGFCSLSLAFEAIGAEFPGPGVEGQFLGWRASSSSREVTIRFRDGSSVRVGGKLVALIAGGYSAARSKQYDRAISSFTAALQMNPDTNIAFAIYSCRASAYYEKGELGKALSDWTAAIQLNSKYARAYYDRAINYENGRDYKLAIRDSTAAIQLNLKYADAYHNRGAYYHETGEFDKAIADFNKAIQFNPRSATTFDGRAQATKISTNSTRRWLIMIG